MVLDCAGLQAAPVPLHWLAYWVHQADGSYALTTLQWERFLCRKRDRGLEIAHPVDGRSLRDKTWDNHGARLRLVPLIDNRGRKPQ